MLIPAPIEREEALILYKCTATMARAHYVLPPAAQRLAVLQPNELSWRFGNAPGAGRQGDLSKAHFTSVLTEFQRSLCGSQPPRQSLAGGSQQAGAPWAPCTPPVGRVLHLDPAVPVNPAGSAQSRLGTGCDHHVWVASAPSCSWLSLPSHYLLG